MITYEAIRTIARKDNEEYPGTASFEIFEVDDEAAKQFAQASVQAYAVPIMSGLLPLDHALMAATLAGMRMGLLIAQELSEKTPDELPKEWTA